MQNTRVDPEAEYYGHLRMSLLLLAKGNPRRVLEIGCGHGQTLAYFKREREAVFTVGVEYVPEVAAVARRRPEIDEILIGDVEAVSLNYPPGSFDLIIAGHVLEHVKDPWAVVHRLRRLIGPGGQFIGSLPNVRYCKVSVPLVVYGKWKYEKEGILDWTHTKFFTRMTIRELLESRGFRVERIDPEMCPNAAFVNRCTFGVFRDLLGWTYNFSALPAEPALLDSAKG